MKTLIVCLIGIVILSLIALFFLASMIVNRKVTIMEASSAPWIAFVAAIVSAMIVAISSIWLHCAYQSAQRKYEILQERKSALFDALKVIDFVYTNEPLTGQTPLNPKEWDIQLARDAMNKMIIYCQNPQRTVETFSKAIGIYNPSVTKKSPGVDIKSLEAFRKEIARELNLPEVTFIAHELGHAFIGLPDDKPHGKNRKGNLMGNGCRGMRGFFRPDLTDDFCILSEQNADILDKCNYFDVRDLKSKSVIFNMGK